MTAASRWSTVIATLAACVIAASLTSAASAQPSDAPVESGAVLFVTNWASDNVSTFRLDANGLPILPAATTAVPAGARNPLAAVVSPDGQRLYVTNWGSGGVSVLGIADDAALHAISTIGSGLVNSAGVAIGGGGRHLYVANFNGGGAGTLSTFHVDGTGLPALSDAQPSQGSGAAGVALSPDGQTLAVANMGTGDVSIFRIGADGLPSWWSTVATGAGAFFPAFTRDGAFLLVANSKANSLSTVDVGPTGPRVIATEPSGGNGPRGVAVDESGVVYLAHYNDGTGPGSATTFVVAADGGLSLRDDAVATGGNGAEAIVAHRNSLYVANFNTGGPGSVSTFRLDSGPPRLLAEPATTGGSEPDFGGIVVHSLDESRS